MATLRLGSFGYDVSSDKAFSFEGLVVLEQTATSLSGDLRRAGKPNVGVQLTGRFDRVAGGPPAVTGSIDSIRATLDGALLYELAGVSKSLVGRSVIGLADGNLSASQQVPGYAVLYGNDILQGGSGNDILRAWSGDDILVGNEGYDTAIIDVGRNAITAVRWKGEALIAQAGRQETDRLISIEAVRFTDGTVALADLPQFRPMQYLAGYADLAVAFGADQDQAWRHFFDHGSIEQRQVIFSGYGYLASYGDLRVAYGTDAEAAARHYLLYGRTEGRAITFDAAQYLAANADLRAAYGADLDQAALHHLRYGAAEGRPTSFDGLAYIASNPDLIPVVPHTVNAGAMHFVQSGASAGRNVWFDPLRYIASNRDLAESFGADAMGGLKHYLEVGASQSRPYFKFNVEHYLETYADLRAAFGTDTRAATVHWIETGADEGREGFYYPPGWFWIGTSSGTASFVSGIVSSPASQETTPV